MSLIDSLSSALGPDIISSIAGSLGAGEAETKSAIFKSAVPMLVGALAKNSEKPDGAAALDSALAKDHDGGLLDNLSGYMSAAASSGIGAGILKHVLGGKQPAAEAQIAKQTGIGGAKASQLLELLAPMVMSALSKKKQDEGLDAEALTRSLGDERKLAEAQADEPSFLVGLLDADGDGDVMDDVMDKAAPLLGKLFG